MSCVIQPALWLLTIIVGLPQISETIYTPALPDIARFLAVAENWVEYTLTIYLVGFAIGTFVWGNLSDRLGRRPCLLFGLLIYIFGCIGCYFSQSITTLMISRFVQALGGSTGSVLGQAICRDVFHGAQRGKAYATIGSALALSPAIGPVLGGIIDQSFGWSAIFLLLICMGLIVFALSWATLPETHLQPSSSLTLIRRVAVQLFYDRRALGFGMLIAAINGIQFSYYAEGSFYLIDLLGLSPATYGLTFLLLAFAGMIGGWLSRKLHDNLTSEDILFYGILVVIFAAMIFTGGTLLLSYCSMPAMMSIILTLCSMMLIMVGSGMVIPSCLSLAVEEYRYAIGTASSLFGFFYYILIALFTMIMGMLHNDSLLRMPLYFLGIGCFMAAIFWKTIRKQQGISL
jgi:Bcr/CflA subfamily drug resistance transporter